MSLRRAALGFAVGVVAALVFGTIAGLSRVGDALVDPPMQMVRTLPLFGLVPLFIIWFGIGETPKIALVAVGVVIPLYLNLVAALRGIDRELYDVAAVFRLTRVGAGPRHARPGRAARSARRPAPVAGRGLAGADRGRAGQRRAPASAT